MVTDFNEFLNEDAFSNNATYPGPNLTNKISGNMVGSGSDGRLGVKRTEIEGGQDGVTSGGEFPLKWGGITSQKMKSRESKQRQSALKKISKLNKMSANGISKRKSEKMKSFDEFSKNDEQEIKEF